MRKYIFIVLFTGLGLTACKKQNDDFTSVALSNYYPLQVGKYITYNLDSTVYTNFGQSENIISYQVQDRIDAQITDNSGRPAYRILRFIRQSADQEWSANNTFMAVPTENAIEFVENNLRFQKLVSPIREGFSWKGNSYLSSFPYPSYDFASSFTDDWDYTYDSVNVPLTLGSITIDSTIKVNQRDEFLGQDPSDPTTEYAERTYAVEKYGRGIGLIYKEFLHWEYQGGGSDFKGFGVKLTMIDHN